MVSSNTNNPTVNIIEVSVDSKKNFFQRNKRSLIALIALVAVTGLIAAPFIYDSKKTIQVLNNGLSSVNSMIQKTGLSYTTFGMIVIGALLAAMVIGLAGAIFVGRKKHTAVDPTSCVISKNTDNEYGITINYNLKDLNFTKVFKEKKNELQSLLDKNISEAVEAKDAVEEVKDTDGNVITEAQEAVEAKDAAACNQLVLNFDNITKDNGLKFAQKIVDQIKIEQNKSIICQFSYSCIVLDDDKNKDLDKKTSVDGIKLKSDVNYRFVNVILTQNLEKNPAELSTSNNIYNSCVKAWNFTLGKISDKIKFAEVTLQN